MTIDTICAIVACALSVSSVILFIGKSLETLHSIGEGIKIALAKTDRHELEITELKVELAKVKTKQEDCGSCP